MKTTRFNFVRVALLACGLLAFGGSVAFAADAVLYTGATVHTVSGETLSPGQVLVKDGKIAGVGAKVAASGTKTVDLTGLHLFPGLIEASTSLGLSEISAVRSTLDTTEIGAYTPDVQSWVAVNPDSELLPVARANGITHFLAVPMGSVVSGQSGLMAMTGWGVEQMTIKKPVAMHLFWPKQSLDLTPREELRDRSKHKAPEEQAKDRQKKLKELDEFFAEAKAYAQARGAGKDAPVNRTPTPAWDAMLPVMRGEVPLMIHADELRQIKSALMWAEARGLKFILAGGRDAWMVADQLAAQKVPVIYDSVFDYPMRDTESYDTRYKAPAILQKAGVKVIFSEGLGPRGATFVRNLPYDAAQAMAFGLPRTEALKGITLYPAQVLSVADRLGSIETGKEASLIAVDGDILDIRANVKRMWIAGQEVSLESRHTRLYEKYKARPKTP